MVFALKYVNYFFEHLLLIWPLLAFLAVQIALLGLIAGRLERWPRFDAIYWAFITATTVGYGDIRPKDRAGKMLSILIAMVGVTFTGIIVAMAINSATLSFKEVHQTTNLQSIIDSEKRGC
jgi:voltage-gated potassium channel